jgi:hypothetical protein
MATLTVWSGCASTSWQPLDAAGPKVLYVTEPCQMNPLLAMPKPVKSPCEDGRLDCYDRENAMLLAHRLEVMQRWIRDARKKCSIMEYQPAAYRLLPPYRRGQAISRANLRLSAGAGSSPVAR